MFADLCSEGRFHLSNHPLGFEGVEESRPFVGVEPQPQLIGRLADRFLSCEACKFHEPLVHFDQLHVVEGCDRQGVRRVLKGLRERLLRSAERGPGLIAFDFRRYAFGVPGHHRDGQLLIGQRSGAQGDEYAKRFARSGVERYPGIAINIHISQQLVVWELFLHFRFVNTSFLADYLYAGSTFESIFERLQHLPLTDARDHLYSMSVRDQSANKHVVGVHDIGHMGTDRIEELGSKGGSEAYCQILHDLV